MEALRSETRLVDISKFNLPERYLQVLRNERIQKYFKEKYDLPPDARVVKRTHSVCPICRKIVEAVVYEHDGAIWIKKSCPEHGMFLDLYWGDAEMYYYYIQWDRPEYIGKGVENPNVDWEHVRKSGLCPFACGLCPMHRSCTILAIIDVTNRCNMRCPICFADIKTCLEYVYEPDIETIDRMLRTLRSERPWAPNALQYSGGEPTLRNDLPELVKLAKERGFKHVEVNTNGVRLAFDAAYYRKLLEAGMSTVYLQCDTVDPENGLIWSYRRYNPKAYVNVRKRVIENARKIGHKSIVLVVTAIKGYNDRDLGKIVNFAIENRDVVRWINIQPVAFAGMARLYTQSELRKMRITIPDVIIEIERQTDGVVSRWDWRPVNWPVALARAIEALTGEVKPEFTNNPVCGASAFIYYDPDQKKPIPITRIVDVDEFERLCWDIYKTAIKGGVWKSIAKTKLLKLVKYVRHKLVRDLILNVVIKRDYDSLGQLMFNVVGLGIMHFMDCMNYDIERVRRCTIHYATPDCRIMPFCTYNNFHRPNIERRFCIPVSEWLKRHPGKSISSYV
ncbi:MAG: radical SAM protein [Crenarchaeota archaeon]|nr:radical SAM protein [Thermoproteota archaeon]